MPITEGPLSMKPNKIAVTVNHKRAQFRVCMKNVSPENWDKIVYSTIECARD